MVLPSYGCNQPKGGSIGLSDVTSGHQLKPMAYSRLIIFENALSNDARQ